MSFKTTFLGLSLLILANCSPKEQHATHEVNIVGEMRNVMWNGQLQGTIYLDTLDNKSHLYGLGPVENLAGEIIIMDGRSFKSTVISDTTMLVEETFDIKAPFFGYTNVSKWSEQTLPDSIETMQQLEVYLNDETENSTRPFMFKLSGTVETATIHIVNLPEGSTVRSPTDAHVGQIDYELYDEQVDLIGFFSTEHKSIFTHHDTFMHIHLITSDLQKMGHLDDVLFKKGGITLFLPAEW